MKNNHSLYHYFYWLFAYFALIGIFSISGDIVQSILFASLLLPVVLLASYLFVYKILTGFWLKERYVLFTLSTAALILFVIQLELLLVATFLITFGEYNIIKVNPNIHDIYIMVTAALMIAFPAIIYETVHQWKQSKQTSATSISTSKSKQIVVRSKGKNVVIPTEQILFMESFGDIIKINTNSAKETISTRMSLTKMEDELPHFIRIHRSYKTNHIIHPRIGLPERLRTSGWENL